MRDVKPIFEWATSNGEAKIADRILVKILPQLLKANVSITTTSIEERETIEVSDEVYELIKHTAQELIKSSFDA